MSLRGRLRIIWSRFKGFVQSEWQLWASLVGIAAAIPLALPLAESLEEQVVTVGVILQVLGLGTVALGLRESRKLFEQPSLWARFAAIFTKPRHHELHAEPGGYGVTMFPPSVTVTTSEEPTIEQRVSALEDGLNELKESFSREKQERDERLKELQERGNVEERERKAADATIREQMETAVIGGLRLEQAGLIWLFVGVICAGVPGLVLQLTSPFRAWLGL